MYTPKSSLEVAVEAAARVDAVLAKKGRIKPNTVVGVVAGKGSVKAAADLFSTEFEINDVPLSARNLLTKGITQEEINQFSGALISTRGRYIHPDDKGKICERALYLYIQGPNKQSLDLAIQRIDAIIKEAMEQEIMKVRSNQPPPPAPQQTLMSGVPQPAPLPNIMPMPGMEKVMVGLDHAPHSFDVRNKVLGPGGANLQYISNETGTIVTLRGRGSGFPEPNTGQESPEPLHLCVEHSKPEVLQQGRQLAYNLVETIQQEFAAVHGQQVVPPPSLLMPQGYQTVNVSQPGVNVGGGGGMLTVQQHADQTIHHNSIPVTGPPGPPGVVATSITLPVFTQQHAGQIVTVPPPSLGVPPPQLMHQPPPQVQLPPPGIHIPSQQGPLVPQSGVQQQQQHQLLVQQQPPPPPPQQHQHQHQQVATSQAAAVHLQLHQQQAAIAASQGQVQLSALSQPPPIFTHPHQQTMTSSATQVINGVPAQHQHHSPLPQQQHQQQQAIITQTSYPVQYIQANGQTIMAYPAGTIRPEQLAAAAAAAAQQPGAQVANQQHITHIPAQLQPGQQIVLQPAVTGQPQQVQLAQLMQNQTIQQHLLHQAQQGQPGTVMLLQYPQQSPQQGHITTSTAPPPVITNDHNHGSNAIVRMPVVRMSVPVQQQAPPDMVTTQLTATSGAGPTVVTQHQLQYSQQGKLMSQIQPQQIQQPPHMQSPPQQFQMQIQPPHQMHHHQMQLPPQQQMQPPPPQNQQPQLQVQIQQQQGGIPRQQQVKSNQDMSLQQDNLPQPHHIGQKRRYPASSSNSQQMFQQSPQPVPPPVHQHPGAAGKQQQVNKQQHIQRQGVGNMQHQPPQPQQQQSPQQDGTVGQVPTAVSGAQQSQGQDSVVIGQQQRVDKELLPPSPTSVASDEWQARGRQQQSPDQNHQQQMQNCVSDQDENKQSDIKRSRLGNSEHQVQQHQTQSRVDRPTFNHYSSKPQMYNSQLPFHMHQIGMYPLPPPPPPPPPLENPGGQYAPPYYQQQQPQFNPPPSAPGPGTAPGGYPPYCMPP